jgi:hypothetical protein
MAQSVDRMRATKRHWISFAAPPPIAKRPAIACGPQALGAQALAASRRSRGPLAPCQYLIRLRLSSGDPVVQTRNRRNCLFSWAFSSQTCLRDLCALRGV